MKTKIGCQFKNKRHFTKCIDCALEHDPMGCVNTRMNEGLVVVEVEE